MQAFVAGVSVLGPGLAGWQASLPVLTGQRSYIAEPTRLPIPSMLAANERRRAGDATRLALAVAQEAAAMSGMPAASLRNVFASSNGDGPTVGAILDALSGEGCVSPTQFHNSVHNAAAGYWSIGAGSSQAATCLGGHDWTVAAGLLTAAAEAQAERRPVLLCLYDVPLPEPLHASRPVAAAFGAALVLTAEPGGFARLRIDYRDQPPSPGLEQPRHPALAELSRGHPIARILRLLETFAIGQPDRLSLAMLDGRIDVGVAPCSTANVSSP